MSDESKPPFDPSKPFESAKPVFDPSQPFQATDSTTAPGANLPAGLQPSDAGDSAIRGYLNLATGSHMPQIAGAVEHPIGALKTLVQGGTGHDVSSDPDVANYIKTRDQYKNLYNQAFQDHPVAYGAGAVAGAVTSPLNKLGAPAAAAAFAEGHSDADLTKGQVGQDLFDASKGAIVGKAGQTVLNAASPAIASAAKFGANQLEQGGLGSQVMDYAAVSAGGLKGLIAKKILAPVASKVGASALDRIASTLQSNPQALGQFAAPLAAAQSKGGNSLAVTNFLLGQQFPDYRKMVSGEDR